MIVFYTKNNVVPMKLFSAKTIVMGEFNARSETKNHDFDFDENEDMLPVRTQMEGCWLNFVK